MKRPHDPQHGPDHPWRHGFGVHPDRKFVPLSEKLREMREQSTKGGGVDGKVKQRKPEDSSPRASRTSPDKPRSRRRPGGKNKEKQREK